MCVAKSTPPLPSASAATTAAATTRPLSPLPLGQRRQGQRHCLACRCAIHALSSGTGKTKKTKTEQKKKHGTRECDNADCRRLLKGGVALVLYPPGPPPGSVCCAGRWNSGRHRPARSQTQQQHSCAPRQHLPPPKNMEYQSVTPGIATPPRQSAFAVDNEALPLPMAPFALPGSPPLARGATPRGRERRQGHHVR